MRYWQKKNPACTDTCETDAPTMRQGGDTHRDAPRKTWSQRLRGVLKILAQVVAIFGTIMAIADTLHRW